MAQSVPTLARAQFAIPPAAEIPEAPQRLTPALTTKRPGISPTLLTAPYRKPSRALPAAPSTQRQSPRPDSPSGASCTRSQYATASVELLDARVSSANRSDEPPHPGRRSPRTAAQLVRSRWSDHEGVLRSRDGRGSHNERYRNMPRPLGPGRTPGTPPGGGGTGRDRSGWFGFNRGPIPAATTAGRVWAFHHGTQPYAGERLWYRASAASMRR